MHSPKDDDTDGISTSQKAGLSPHSPVVSFADSRPKEQQSPLTVWQWPGRWGLLQTIARPTIWCKMSLQLYKLKCAYYVKFNVS